jgi:hypothetical protein
MRIVTVIAAGLAAVGAMVSLSNTAQAQVVIRCAREGQNCYVPNKTAVLYGRDGAVIAKSLSSVAIPCTAAAFGGDPVASKDKICILLFYPASHSWRFCANGEIEICGGDFVAGKVVRYGDPISNKWVYGSFFGRIPCSTSLFGDPAPGRLKICQYTQ